MANNPIISRVTGVGDYLRTRTQIAPSVTRGQALVAGVGLAAAGVGAGFALRDAIDLYSNRLSAANQFQNQLQFPADLIPPGNERAFFMSFGFMAYEKRSINNSPFLRSRGTVRLPIPDAIRDNLSVSYNSPSLGPVVGAALDAAAGTITTGTAGNLLNTAANAAVAGVTGLGADILNRTGAAGQAAQAYLGTAVNPYQTVLFEKPEFKTHNFSWKIMPRSIAESDEARNIFRTFQFHASPGVSSGTGVFFSYPSMVIVSLYPSSEFLYRFKPCVIKSVNVNYAAGSNPSFFKRTNAPTAMTLSIQLQEIEYWTNNDYTSQAFDETTAENRARDIEIRSFSQLSAFNSATQPLSNRGD